MYLICNKKDRTVTGNYGGVSYTIGNKAAVNVPDGIGRAMLGQFGTMIRRTRAPCKAKK